MPHPLTRLKSGRAIKIGGTHGGHLRPSPRALAMAKPLLPGQQRCDTCGNGVPPRKDGTMRAHQQERGIPCPAVESTFIAHGRTGKYAALCEHGNDRPTRDRCGCPLLIPITPTEETA